MAPPRVVRLVVSNATQKTVTGAASWAAVRHATRYAIVRAVTAPADNMDEWRQVVWSGDIGKPSRGKPNERRLSLKVAKRLRVTAALGGVSMSVDLWVIWATVRILTRGPRPANSAPFDVGSRDGTSNLGAVVYDSVTASVIDEAKGVFVTNKGTSGKVAPLARLQPKGIGAVIRAGWAFRREITSRDYFDGVLHSKSAKKWRDDTSKPAYLRLIPDDQDQIYDLDGPDIRWGQQTCETYNNFRQWIEWNGERCSDSAPWFWRARWKLHRDPNKQITLREVGTGNRTLPSRPHYPPPRRR